MPATVNTNTLKTNWPNGYSSAMVQFLRPADAVAYSIGDQISDTTGASNWLQFTEGQTCGGQVMDAILMTGASVAADYDLLLFDAAPTAVADNVAAGLVAADMQKLIGMFNFKTANKSTVNVIDIYRGMDSSLAAYSPMVYYGSLYGLLIARTAIALGSGLQITIRLGIDRSAFAAT
jgi:hypothetical protein